MVRQGVLLPAQAGEFVAKNAKHVKIHEEGLEKLSQQMLSSITDKLEIPDTGADIIRPSILHPRAADWVFVADALNFCFWSFKDADKWTVDGHTGYYALEAALARAIKLNARKGSSGNTEGCDITNPECYFKLTKDQLHHIMKGDNEAQIPLLDQRLSVLQEVGTILLEKYNGTFETCLKEADKSAVKLLEIVVDNFPCFRDETMYKGQALGLYKRAQILVADLWNFFDGKGWGEFKDISKITMFADYRVPQVLVFFGAMSYSEELMEKLKNDIVLESGSEEEVEIRACSIHAVELLRNKIEEKIKEGKENVEVPNSSLIDYYLWCYRRKYADELEKVPFHKTFGIFY